MLKLTVAVVAVALAGSASAAGWRSLRIDASSEASFNESVATFQDKLSPSRRVAFARSLQDIWREGTQRANAEQREYTSAEYFREIHGLAYEQVIRVTDPTGEKAQSYRAGYYHSRAPGGSAGGRSVGGAPLWNAPAPPPVQNGVYRGWTTNGVIRVDMNTCGC